jgi:tetratricopeptide (TPR) repeat protein
MSPASPSEDLLREAAAAMRQRDWASALKTLQRARVLAAELDASPDWIHDVALCHFHLDRKQEALEGLDRAADLQPDYGYRYASRAWMRQALGDVEGARADYEKAIALDPEDAISHNNLGLLEEQMGYRREAQRRFQVADELREMLATSGIGLDPPPMARETPPVPPISPAGAMPEARPDGPTPWSLREFVQFLRNGFKLKP